MSRPEILKEFPYISSLSIVIHIVRTRMWTLVGARIAHFWIERLGSVHLPVGTRDGHSHAINVKSPNSSKSRVIYLVSGYEERVGEVFESQVTRLNAWKDARVQRMHIRVCTDVGCAGRHPGRARGRRQASGQASMRPGVRVGRAGWRATDARLALFTRE
ncbi:hypothetical protein CRG98_006198 [Punica granatum]|uniref:Uncharacterized protein n=1 Tax=Punica granatum TaxID=22663 RepID=A0A2I0KY72_PUNGR|nr:hypothetical protein CRG98_006198 [Punica granatum]